MPPRNRQRPSGPSMLTPQPEPLFGAPARTPDPRPDPTPVEDVGHRGEVTEALVYLSARVPKGLRAEVQHQSIREGRPVAQLVQDAMRAYLDVHNST